MLIIIITKKRKVFFINSGKLLSHFVDLLNENKVLVKNDVTLVISHPGRLTNYLTDFLFPKNYRYWHIFFLHLYSFISYQIVHLPVKKPLLLFLIKISFRIHIFSVKYILMICGGIKIVDVDIKSDICVTVHLYT